MNIDKEVLREVLLDYIELITVSGDMYDNHTDYMINKARLILNELHSANTNSEGSKP